jgi:hypothetical protein
MNGDQVVEVAPSSKSMPPITSADLDAGIAAGDVLGAHHSLLDDEAEGQRWQSPGTCP